MDGRSLNLYKSVFFRNVFHYFLCGSKLLSQKKVLIKLEYWLLETFGKSQVTSGNNELSESSCLLGDEWKESFNFDFAKAFDVAYIMIKNVGVSFFVVSNGRGESLDACDLYEAIKDDYELNERLVVKFHSKIFGVDYSVTFPPATRLDTIRRLLVIAAQKEAEFTAVVAAVNQAL
uniref:Uncharacterized protein n=1 Tax=Solanum lycopersicum TaxID=4081 RepID=A0A3Q7JU34_SOLLC